MKSYATIMSLLYYTIASLSSLLITQSKQKEFISFKYAAKSWNQPRKIVTKIEYNRHGSNIRCVITILPEQDVQAIYDEHYCPRDEIDLIN